MSRRVVYGALALVYALFFFWYTSFEGPLTDAEIAAFMARAGQGDGSAEDRAALRRFLENDTGDDFAMLNIIEMRETPVPVAGVDAGESSSEVLSKYMAYMWPALLTRACHPVFSGTAAAPALDVWGIEGAEQWTSGALMRYRSRRDMLEIAANPEFQGPHEFKIAAMAKTIAFPVDPWMTAGDPRLLLALVLLIVALLVPRTR